MNKTKVKIEMKIMIEIKMKILHCLLSSSDIWPWEPAHTQVQGWPEKGQVDRLQEILHPQQKGQWVRTKEAILETDDF